MDNVDITLSLLGEESVSHLKALVFEEELKEINSKFPIYENQVDIQQTYFIKKGNSIEVGFFIRNASKNKVSIEEMPLVLQDSNNKTVLSKQNNFKDSGIIPPYSARQYSVDFKINEDINISQDEKYTIKFGEVSNINTFSAVPTEVENMSLDISFEEEKAIRDFINGLQTLKAEEFTVSLYNLSYNNKGGLECALLFRNGSSKIANVGWVPIVIVGEDGVTIAQKVFGNDKQPFQISPQKSKLMKFEFEPFEAPKEKYDLSKCKVIY